MPSRNSMAGMARRVARMAKAEKMTGMASSKEWLEVWLEVWLGGG